MTNKPHTNRILRFSRLLVIANATLFFQISLPRLAVTMGRVKQPAILFHLIKQIHTNLDTKNKIISFPTLSLPSF